MSHKPGPLDSPLFPKKLQPKPYQQTAYEPAVSIDRGLRYRILVITGLPGVGKTTVASGAAHELRCTHFNADQVRQTINAHLGFTKTDRLTQAKTLGHMARWVADSGQPVVVDFVCPDFDTRDAFLSCLGDHREFVTWIELSRPNEVSRYEDTRKMYEPMHDSPNLDLLRIKRFKHFVNDGKRSAGHIGGLILKYFEGR